MQTLLARLREVYGELPSGASPHEIAEFEQELDLRLPRALRQLYLDHNGEPRGALGFRLLPLRDVYQVDQDRWCFWEDRYDSLGPGADYSLARGTVWTEQLTFANAKAFLEDLLSLSRPAPAPLPSIWQEAEKLDCAQRQTKLLQALQETPVEWHSQISVYLQDDDPLVAAAVCDWMAQHRVTAAIPLLASLSQSPTALAKAASRRALASLGAQLLELNATEPIPPEFQTLWNSQGVEATQILLLRPSTDQPWQVHQLAWSAKPQAISFCDQVRNKPQCYFGPHGGEQAALEVVANSVDQFLQGQATKVQVQHDQWTLQVQDDGAGYPLDSNLGLRYLTEFHDSPTVDQHAPHVHLITKGLGLAPVNAVCAELEIESVRQQQGYRVYCRQGQILEHGPAQLDFSKGTRVRLQLDQAMWTSGIASGILRRRLFDFVHLIPGLLVTLNQETFHAPRGLLDLVEFNTIGLHGPCLRLETRNDFLILHLAVVGRTSRTTQLQSWVNGAKTIEHGSHVDGALAALEEVGWRPAHLLVHAILNEPRYAGPVTRRLQVPKVMRQVRSLLRAQLAEQTIVSS